MKVVILAGGFGTRLSEETVIKPKPMVEVGGRPIIWHIMKYYASYGHNEFIICLGYKGHLIKEYFLHYHFINSDFRIDLDTNTCEVLRGAGENWKVTLVDTGHSTMTGGRIRRIEDYIDGTFMLTYGDGLSDIDINELVSFHTANDKKVTMTSVLLEGRYGYLTVKDNSVSEFVEKGKSHGNLINAGFFVCEPEVMNYIKNDQTVFEKDPLETLVEQNQLGAYQHPGHWKCMDTLKDLNEFEVLWETNPFWKRW